MNVLAKESANALWKSIYHKPELQSSADSHKIRTCVTCSKLHTLQDIQSFLYMGQDVFKGNQKKNRNHEIRFYKHVKNLLQPKTIIIKIRTLRKLYLVLIFVKHGHLNKRT